MPIVNVQGFGTVQFPDEMAPDAIEAAIRADIEPLIDRRRRIAAGQAAAQLPPVSPTLAGLQGAGSALSSAAGSVVQGGVSALTSPLKLAGTIADRIRANVPPAALGPQLAVGGAQSAFTTGAEAIQQAAERIAPTNPAVEQTFFGGTLPQGLGNAGAMLATGGLAGLGAKAAGRAAQPAAVAGATAVGFTAEFDDAFQRAVQAGQDPDTALAKSLGYAGVAAAIENKLGMGRVLRKYFGSADEAAKALTARGVSQEFLKDALAGFGEEASQRVAQDVIIEGKLDPKGIVEEGAAGGIIQALMGLPALNRQAVPKTGTAQAPVTPNVTPPAPEQPKVEVTRDLAKELQAALTGNQGKATPVTPDVTPPAPAQPAGPLRFRAIVEEGKVPSELVIQPLTEELYDAVIHVPGLTPDFDQFKAENPEATHLKRQLLPTGKFASGHKFGPLNELVPTGIGSQWEDITNPEPSTKNQAPPGPTSPPPPAAAVPPPAAPAPPAPAAAVSPAPATAQTPQALPSSPAGDSLAAPLTPPAPGPGAPAQSVAKQRRRNPAVEEIWRKYAETGEIETARDLADALDGVEKLPAPLTKAVRMFRKAIQDDVKEFGQRSGLEDQFANQLESVVEKYVAGTPAPPAAVEQERKPAAVDVSTIEQATTEQEMYKATGALLTAAKTEAEMAKIRAAQRRWIEQREAAALTPPAPEPGAADAPFSRRSDQEPTSRQKLMQDFARGAYKDSTIVTPEEAVMGDMMDTLRLPSGWTVEETIPSKWGSAYWQLTDPDGDRWKVSVRDHPPSPFREKEFGASDLAAYIDDANVPEMFAEGMAKLEAKIAALAARLPEIKAQEQRKRDAAKANKAAQDVAELEALRGKLARAEAKQAKRVQPSVSEQYYIEDLRKRITQAEKEKARQGEKSLSGDSQASVLGSGSTKTGDRTESNQSGSVNSRADTGSAVGTASQKRAEQQDGGAFSRRSDRDAEYLAAVERGDLAAAQRMVDEAAKAAGWSGGFYHGTIQPRFNIFSAAAKTRNDFGRFGRGFYFTKARNVAEIYAGKNPFSWGESNLPSGATVFSVFLKLKNPKVLDARTVSMPESKQAAEAETAKLIQEGHDGVIGTVVGKIDSPNTEYVVFSPSQIKSADPVTYDDAGRVIPLSERFNSESNDIRNSRAEAAAEPAVSVASAQARADELTAKWVLPFGVEVVQSWRDLPARARRGITEQDGHTVEGRYVPGSGVFLVADNLGSADRVAAVVLHEVLGHFGVDTVLGEQRDDFMLDVFRSFQGKPLFQQKVRDYAGDFENGRTPVTQADKILLGRELVAALAENPAENPGLWQRIVDAVRRWLRDIGWVQDVTEADIREALRRADRELRGEMSNVQRPTSNAQPAYASRLEPRELSELGFYDTILEALKRWQPKGTPEQLMAHLAKTRGALEQAEWIGLPEFLKGKPIVTNAEVAQFTRDNAVEVREVVKGGDAGLVVEQRPSGNWVVKNRNGVVIVSQNAFGEPIRSREGAEKAAQNYRPRGKFEQYQLPGGENYRELLLTLPEQTKTVPDLAAPVEVRQNIYGDQKWYHVDRQGEWGTVAFPTREEALAALSKVPTKEVPDTFNASHFDEPNILAHVRFNERTDAQGRRVLFLEEVQSDWHKAGRKQGYAKARWTDAEEARVRELESPRPYPGLSAEERAEYAALISKTGQTGVPDAPFKGTWPMLVMKRMLRWAAENNFDSVAWITGDQTAERYDLSKQVDSVRITRLFGNKGWTVEADKGGREVISKQAESEQELEALVGKDLAAKAVQDGGGTYAGVDLKVGGEWARSLYDRTLPNEVNKFVKKWGGKVERAEIVTVDKPVRIVERGGNFSVMVGDSDAGRFGSRALAEEHAAGFGPQKETVHSLTLTPDLKDAALAGMPLFARRNKVLTGEQRARNFANWFRNSKVVNADGTPRVVYHGSKRPDRIGTKFLKKRATSGPMAFFTDDPEIASNYATSKRDTSLEHPDDYSGWFKFKPPGSRTSVPIDRAWWFLSAEQRAKLADTLPRVSITDENGDSLPDGQYRLTAPGETGLMPKDSWDYELRQARGNSLKAAVEAWLNSGSLFNREDEFLDVLRTAGLNDVQFDSPWAEYSGVFPVHLSIQNPLNTAAIPENVIAELNAVGKRKRARGQYGADQWDKNTVSGPDWLERLNNDQKDGTAHAWTSIPDWVTDTLIGLGYDGIQDTGGKKGGRQHGVWIPFFESQVKSATGNRGTYDPESNDMTFSRTSQPEPRESDDLPKRVGTRNASGENATEDALRDQTVINVAAMRKDPKLVAKVEALIRAEYPQLRLAEGQDPIEALTQFVENNLIWLHNQMDPEVRARAKLWYDGARKIVLQWEQQYGRPREAVAAVIAKLSPQRDWFQNLELAERVIAITNQLTGDEKLTDEMDQEILSWIYKKPTAKQVETPEKEARFYANQAAFAEEHFAMRHVAYRDMNPWQKAVFVRAYSSTALPNRYNIWTPEGERLGFKYKKPETKTKKPKPLEEAKLGWPGFDTIAGAISILENPTLQNISDTLGNEHKIRNFYNNIILPNSEYGDVTIDTHAVAAGQLKALAGDDMEVGHNFGTGAPSSDVIGVSGLYAIYADAYRRAAAQLGLQPRQLQSITWEEIRALFTEEFKAQEANKQLVENVWQRYAAGNLTLEEARNEIKALATDSQPDWVGVQSGAPATQTPWTLPDRGQLSGVRRYFEGRPRQRRSEEFAAALDQAAARRAAGLSPFSRTTQPTEPLPDLLARRDDAAARGITYAAQREKLRSEGKTIPESLKKAEREQAEIFKEASFQLLRHPDYVAQQVRAVDAKLDELNTLKERQRILKQQGTDLESDARARLAELEQWLPIETGEIPYGNADEFVGIPPSLVKQAIERTSGLKHFVTEAEKERVRAILDNPDLSPEQKDRLLADLERNRGRALAEVPLPNALPPRANVALATSTTLAGNQDARTWWESFARWARNLASATPEIPLFGPLARLNVPMRGFLNAIRAGNMTAARDAEAMVQDVVQPLLALPRTQLDPNALARHQAIARKLQAAERQFDQQAERMRAEIAAMEQMRADRAAITERREALAEFEGNPPAKIAELQRQLAEAVDKLGTNPMWLFKQAVLFRDYVSRFQMLAPKQQGRFKFPGNLSIQDVVNELERTNAAIEASPARAAIKEAMDRHYRAMTELEAELLKRGHLIPEAMKNGAYFPHQVLDYTSQHLGRLKPATEAPFRGYLVDPTGSRKAIETDYIQAVYRHAAEVMAHNAHQDAVEKFLKPWDKSDSLRETVAAKAAAEGRTAGRFEWRSEDNLPPGYVFYDAAKKLPLRLGYVMDPQTIADALGIALKDGDVIEQMRKLGVDFVVEPEMLQQALVAGEKQPWVIPKEMAEALDGILERQRQEDAIARAPVTRRLRQAVALWKLNTLFAPWHYIRYEWGNTMSDVVDKLGGADPGMAKYLPQAFKEVIAFADKKEATPEIRAAFEQRVLDTITFAEVEKVKDSPAFEQLRSDTQRALGMVGTAAKNVTFPPLPIIRLLSGANVRSTVELSRLREATFRYAKFLTDLNRIRNGERPVYAGAYWKDVEAERTPEEKAAFIARRTFGDYGDLSVAGEYLRRNLVPFWSWTEINFRYHVNLLRNMADMIRKGEFGDAAQSARAIAAWTALRLALPYAAVHLWNTVGGAMAGAWDDDDDLEATLSDADRRRFHLILGKDERGQTKVIYMPTAFSDVVSWFGGDNAARLLAEYARGEITFERVVGDFAKQIGPDTLNKVAQSTGPIGKGAFIAVSGKQPFPDITNMRSVGGREKWFAVVQTMTDREGTDLLRRAFDNDYYPRPAGEVAQQLILQIRRRDPEQWAFYEVKEKVSQWKEQKTGKRFEAGDYQAPEAQALRGFRRAVYLGDVDAAERFYNRLLGFGYTSERLTASIRNQHPLAELNEEGRKEFIKSLSRADREQLRRALQYWERLSTLKGKERGLFPAKPGQRFTPQPERLRNAVESFDRRSDEDVERTARRLVDAALAGRR